MRKLRLRKNKQLIQGHTADTKIAELGQKSKCSALFHAEPGPSIANIKLLTFEKIYSFKN